MGENEENYTPEIVSMVKTIKRFKYWSYLLITLIFLMTFTYVYFKGFQEVFSDPQTLGTVGDFFGGVLTPIITFFALLTLFTIVNLQKMQLRYTIDALEASWEALQGQKEGLDKQNFENTFFALIDLYNKNTANLKLNIISERLPDNIGRKPPNKMLSGLDVIDHISAVSKRRALESSKSQGVDPDKTMVRQELYKLVNQLQSTIKLRMMILSSIIQHLKSSKTQSNIYLTILNTVVSVPEKYIIYILLSDKRTSIEFRYLKNFGFFAELEDLRIGPASFIELFK